MECLIFGAGLGGKIAKLFLEEKRYDCLGFIDEAAGRIGTEVEGLSVYDLPEAAEKFDSDTPVFIAPRGNFFHPMKKRLESVGFTNCKFLNSELSIEEGSREMPRFDTEAFPQARINETAELLEDDYSKSLYRSVVEHHRARKQLFVDPKKQYFDKYLPKHGDVIIDCGVAHGDFIDNLLTYEQEIKVYAFEADRHFYELLVQKYDNPNISIINKCVYSEEGEVSFSDDNSHGSNAINSDGAIKMAATSIDCFVQTNSINKVDWIKMDIEGAELDAIEGAKETLRTHAPFLSISIYHKTSDLWEIPLKIKALQPDYTFYVDHYSSGMGETILYACP